jgi:hypothetical protein
MSLRKKRNIDEIVIYNFDIRSQKVELLYRGQDIPLELKGYTLLWRVVDKTRRVETVIISV